MKKPASSKSTKKSNSNALSLDSANQVTSFSRIFAAALFVALPFGGFILGYNYQNELTEMYSACMQTASVVAGVTR